MADYDKLLDDEIKSFVADTEACYPPDLRADDLQGQRDAYDGMARHFHHGRPAGVDVADGEIAGVRVRRYGPGPAQPVVIYIHGGGFILGGLESHDDVCAEICEQTGLRVVSVDYRLAPEHVFPAQFDDSLAVVQAMAAEGPVILVGDSAGGNLCAGVAQRLGREGGILGQVLIYPGVSRIRDRGSFVEHRNAPLLNADESADYAGMLFGGPVPPAPETRAFPLDDDDFSHLPPSLALGAECDPLADEAPRYAEALKAAGVQATGIVEPGLVHGHLRARHRSARAARSFARVIAGVKAIAAGEPV